MADTVDPNPSKIGMAAVTLRAMLAASGRLWTSPFKGSKGAPTYFKDVIFTLMRSQLGNSPLSYLRANSQPTSEAYKTFAEKQGFAPDTVTLPSGTQAHWIGDRNAEKVILFSHGGGYVLPITPGHLLWLQNLTTLLPSTSILVLSYSLAPEHKYPHQLTQAIEALSYLLTTANRSPSSITLAGDSAGGNLTAGILSHLAHPHPSIPPISLPAGEKLRAAILISPWVSFNIHTNSYTTNREKDCFDGQPLSRWSADFLGSSSPFAGDFYSEPITAPSSWWEGVEGLVEEVLIWGGKNEIFIDGIEEFGNRFSEGFARGSGGVGRGRVQVIVSPDAAHEEPILEVLLGYKGDSGSGSKGAVEGWLKAKL